jgi:nucleoside-diphosphate-sugar epimerase
MNKVLVTGASGFVGGQLVNCLDRQNISFEILGRRDVHDGKFPFSSTGFLKDDSYYDVLEGVSTVVHCAARVHIMDETAANPLEEFRAFNVEATLSLARQAAEKGVKRFIFLSTIKVNGETTTGSKPFSAFDIPHPVDPYGVSKAEAESGLKSIAEQYGMEFVIIRPPLVYGPGVKANFAALMAAVNRKMPLPLRMIKHNRRSMVSVVNLVDLIVTCLEHPAARNEVFLVSDDEDISTSTMVALMARACGKPNVALPLPAAIFKLAGAVLNKADMVDRLVGSLQLDISHTKETLSWSPPQTIEEGFAATFNWLHQS